MRNGQLLPKQQQDMDKWLGLEGYSYGNLMRVCRNPSQAVMLTREGEYGWDGWLGMYFANFPKEDMTILMGMQKKDAGTFPLTRKLRNVVISEYLGGICCKAANTDTCLRDYFFPEAGVFCNCESYILRNSVGVHRFNCLNIRKKADRLEKPDCIATSVTASSGSSKRDFAYSILFWFRNL